MNDLLDPAPRDLLYAWVIGVIGALALAVYGSICIYEQSATWVGGSDFGLAFGDASEMHCRGASAVAIGIGCIAAATLLHFHFFWSWRERFFAYAQLGKLVSLIVITVSVVCFLLRFWFD